VIYHEAYIVDPIRILADARKLAFVIDVQDIARFQEALDYFA
jgi:hypothetical protein